MHADALRALLDAVASGDTSIDEALRRLEASPFEDLGFARVDHHRAIRDGLPEVVLALGKTPAQVATIAVSIVTRSDRLLVTRLDDPQATALRAAIPGAVYNADARLAWYDPNPAPREGHVAVVCAGIFPGGRRTDVARDCRVRRKAGCYCPETGRRAVGFSRTRVRPIGLATARGGCS